MFYSLQRAEEKEINSLMKRTFSMQYTFLVLTFFYQRREHITFEMNRKETPYHFFLIYSQCLQRV